MIALGDDFLLFEQSGGEAVPLSAEMVTIELTGDAEKVFEPDFVDNAASAVFHYFKYELKRQSVTMAEFADALERALKSISRDWMDTAAPEAALETDLRLLADRCGAGCELVFFQSLRSQLRELLKQSPQTVHFSGLKDCVKVLTGARRWSPECRSLKDQILSFLRECLSAEAPSRTLSVVVK